MHPFLHVPLIPVEFVYSFPLVFPLLVRLKLPSPLCYALPPSSVLLSLLPFHDHLLNTYYVPGHHDIRPWGSGQVTSGEGDGREHLIHDNSLQMGLLGCASYTLFIPLLT